MSEKPSMRLPVPDEPLPESATGGEPTAEEVDAWKATAVKAFGEVSGRYPNKAFHQVLALEIGCREGKYAPFTSFFQMRTFLNTYPDGFTAMAVQANVAHEKINERLKLQEKELLPTDLEPGTILQLYDMQGWTLYSLLADISKKPEMDKLSELKERLRQSIESSE